MFPIFDKRGTLVFATYGKRLCRPASQLKALKVIEIYRFWWIVISSTPTPKFDPADPEVDSPLSHLEVGLGAIRSLGRRACACLLLLSGFALCLVHIPARMLMLLATARSRGIQGVGFRV